MRLEQQPPQARIGLRHMRKIEDIESDIIRTAIAHYDGHMSEVVRRLGIGRLPLYRKLKEFELEATVQQTDGTPESSDERKVG